MTLSDMLNLILSTITIFIAALALILTYKQIKLSNKQHLFDRRLDNYLLIKDILSLYNVNKSFIDDKDIYKNVKLLFLWLTNCKRLENIAPVIKEPTNEELKRNFLIKCEELEKSANEILLLWQETLSRDLYNFVNDYVFLLHALYKQQLAIGRISPQIHEGISTKAEADEQLKECAEHISLFKITQKLKELYDKIVDEKIEQKLTQSLRL